MNNLHVVHLCFLIRHFDKQNFNYREGYTSAPAIALCIHIVCGVIDRGGILSLLELVANMLSGGRAAVGLASSAGQRPKLFLPAPKSGHSGLSGRPVPASRCCHFLVQWPLDRGLPMASASTQTQPPPSAPATGTFSFYGDLFFALSFLYQYIYQGSTST